MYLAFHSMLPSLVYSVWISHTIIYPLHLIFECITNQQMLSVFSEHGECDMPRECLPTKKLSALTQNKIVIVCLLKCNSEL